MTTTALVPQSKIRQQQDFPAQCPLGLRRLAGHLAIWMNQCVQHSAMNGCRGTRARAMWGVVEVTEIGAEDGYTGRHTGTKLGQKAT